MWLILLSFLLFIGLFVVGLRWGVVVIGKILGRVVNDRHQNAEFIINTGQVPEQWTSAFYKKIDEINKAAGTNDLEKRQRVSSLESKAKRYSIKRINDLLKYLTNSLPDSITIMTPSPSFIANFNDEKVITIDIHKNNDKHHTQKSSKKQHKQNY